MEKKKREKSGGRQKGSINKVTSMNKQVINQLLSEYQDSGLMYADFEALEPKDRITIAEKFMQYTMPKMQSTSVELETKNCKMSIEGKLLELSKPKTD